ncbi:DUF1540 domain-containing protein [Rummeliibacillus sp. G93]|uniref:DUF1540 domain-containing protein n=1 Tax=Rummeliibacillus TaxID=648802 RepID=UPI00123AC62F|nr:MULTISPECIES: DUF1540 domain-containing protein [Rummeliibacillus]MCM3316615.1 DUF1540 domain-containing protein [Rummeliibacillus stabekisii]UQW96144.1 DUF1540 domain-containing protein [Rummeliibacillus sp. G93]
MPNVQVNCSVSDCFFHKVGNVCGASAINVDMDYHSRDKDTEFATEFDFDKISEKANTSKDTCCKTFKPKEK